MKEVFTVGSRAFFSMYPDFRGHDVDTLILTDEIERDTHKIVRKNCYFYRNPNKEKLLETAKRSTLYASMFLVPDVSGFLGITIDNLKELSTCFEKFPSRWKYQSFIYTCYIENGDFILTQQQRDKAYDIYRSARNI